MYIKRNIKRNMLYVYGLHIQSEMLANPPIATGQVMKNRNFYLHLNCSD